jgi:small subunit ribosomal protein S24e
MEIDIIEKKENKVLNRTEVKFSCIYTAEATPKILDVKSKLITLLNTKKDLIVIDSLQPNFGEAKATGYTKIYDTREDLESIEPENIILKNKEPEAPPKEEEESPAEDESSDSTEEENPAEDEGSNSAE